jgi:hypothetical protein
VRAYRVIVSDPTIARTLRDAGFEVIFVGPGQSPEQLAETVLCEDADAILGDDDVKTALDTLGLTDVLVVDDPADLLSALLGEGQ